MRDAVRTTLGLDEELIDSVLDVGALLCVNPLQAPGKGRFHHTPASQTLQQGKDKATPALTALPTSDM